MSGYTYTDHNGDSLSIGSGMPEGTVWVQITHGDTGWVQEVKREDAPAAALAILEAAGYGGTEAAGFVRGQVAALADAAEREALDDKVRAYLNRVLLNKVGDMYRITDHDRAEYARAAEFFQGEQ